MSFENLTRCPRCKRSLALTPTWGSHERRWKKPQVLNHEFDFRCIPCNREYTLKDMTLMDKAPEIVPDGEDEALEPMEKENAVDYRCPECGGPIMKDLGTFLLICIWCNQEYVVSDGELQRRVVVGKR